MSNDKKLSLLGHIYELRHRLIKSVIAVLITTVISFIFAKQIFYILILPAGGINLIFIEMTEMISTYMKVSLASGIILAMPYLIYQLIMFVSPALTAREKKYVYIILPWIALMFTAGVLFGYFILIPPATKFLITFGSDIATPQIKIGNYISIVTRLLLAIGLVFEMPVVTTFLSRLGIITPKWLASKRKAAIILAFILAAIITPTFDPINQSLVAIPLIILYEISIWLAKLVYKKRAPQEIPLPSAAPQE
ncbi:MAG: twin-arginine translocase subunit TatC [Dehalococcoidia bacterium]|nr:MAG: twin-arginine translocase subunit TatC [Dehalococcoidia bacterium]